MPDVAALQKQIDTFTAKAEGAIDQLGTDAKKSWDELRTAMDGQSVLSEKGLKEANENIVKHNSLLEGYEKKQGELITQLADMHKAVSRIGGGDAANDGAYERKASNIVSLEDYHKSAHIFLGAKISDGYLHREKGDAEVAYESAYFKGLLRGSAAELQKLQDDFFAEKSLIVSDLTSMGFYVPPAIAGRVIDKFFETSPMQQHAEVTNLASGNTLEHIVDRAQFSFQLLDEVTTPSDSDVANLQVLTIEAYESVTKVPVSRRTIQDAGINTAEYVSRKAGERMGRGFNNLYVNGTGGTQPDGILTTAIATTADDTRAFGTLQNFVTENATAFDTDTPDNLIEMVVSLKSVYEANAKWFMNKFTVGEVRKLKDGQGNYLWQPDFTKLASSTLIGYPLIRFEDMPKKWWEKLPLPFFVLQHIQ
ncbi:MAG: phage major capsid protein [Proteobacteria bacterium]|nr:phage major capsid protein [Pseudomonadota bacterium]